jgi:hypothetical protein
MSFHKKHGRARDGLANDFDRIYILGVLRWRTKLVYAYSNLRIAMPDDPTSTFSIERSGDGRPGCGMTKRAQPCGYALLDGTRFLGTISWLSSR